MTKRIAIIGAGPSGLASAKAVLELGLEPTVFEAAAVVGGLWRNGGYTWPGMRTNISKYNCAFSDYPWPDDIPDFPNANQVEGYLRGYAIHFRLLPYIETSSRVAQIRRKGDGWAVSVDNGAPRDFDGVIAASGIFAKPDMPEISDRQAIHSAHYKGVDGKSRVAVIGGLMSGVEIATHAAEAGAEVLLITDKPAWILPRVARLDGYADAVPLDLAMNRRNPNAPPPSNDRRERFRKTAEFFASQFDNPGKIYSQLNINRFDEPPHVAISDRFLDHVANGEIHVIRGRVEVRQSNINLIKADQKIFCTGYQTDLSYLGTAERMQIGYRAEDKFLPFVADSSGLSSTAARIVFCRVVSRALLWRNGTASAVCSDTAGRHAALAAIDGRC